MTSTAFFSFAIASHPEAVMSAEVELCVPHVHPKRPRQPPQKKENCGRNTAAKRNEDDSACSA
eukprot:5342247-Amphidinium_carterae.1